MMKDTITKERNRKVIFRRLFILFVTLLCFLTFHVSYGLSQTTGNEVHSSISHTFWYSDQTDLIMDIPYQMDNTWFFAVINLPDTGENVTVTKITTETDVPIEWWSKTPTSVEPYS